MVVKRLLVFLTMPAILFGCSGEQKTYKVSGEITNVSCVLSTKLTLNNGVSYSFDGSAFGDNQYCELPKGLSVTILHDDNLRINDVLIEGTEEVTN